MHGRGGVRLDTLDEGVLAAGQDEAEQEHGDVEVEAPRQHEPAQRTHQHRHQHRHNVLHQRQVPAITHTW